MVTMISFSGGRSSAMMAKILCDNLPPDERIICFANTGKEHEATLEFVGEFEIRFGEKIHWIEYAATEQGFIEVDFASASRNGEPYAAMLAKKSYLPNAVARFCTTELKIRPIKKFMMSLGFDEWYNAVGIRYDEPGRKAKLATSCAKERWESIAPLFGLRVTKPKVLEFWRQQPFDLQIPEHLGNCDACFLKSKNKLKHIFQTEPHRFDWWIEQERKSNGATFNKSYSYLQLSKMIDTSPHLFSSLIEADCLCTID